VVDLLKNEKWLAKELNCSLDWREVLKAELPNLTPRSDPPSQFSCAYFDKRRGWLARVRKGIGPSLH